MALTLGDLSMHLVAKAPQDLTVAERDTLADLLAWANAEIYAYIGSDSVISEVIRDAAIRRIAYYDYHTRLSRRPGDGGRLAVNRRGAPLGPLRASGALSLLAPFKVRHVGVAADD